MSAPITSTKDLCQWLRDNSAGIYRPAAEAADLIERLERAQNTIVLPESGVPEGKWMRVGPAYVVNLREENAKLRDDKARLDWLDDCGTEIRFYRTYGVGEPSRCYLNQTSARAAIDAARSKAE